MRLRARYLPAVALLLAVSGICYAQGDDREGGNTEEQEIERQQENEQAYRDHRRQIQDMQDALRAEPRFSDEQRQQVLRRATAGGLMQLAENLQNLYDLGHARNQRNGGTGGEIGRLKQDSLDRIGQLLSFANQGTTPPPTDAIEIPDTNFQVRVADLSDVFRQFLTPMATLIIGDILDLKMLEQVRSDLALMDVMIRTAPEAEIY
jgi:hypothetical protein